MGQTQTVDKLLPDGALNPDWIAGLGETALRQWIASVLQQRDPDFPAWTVSEPHDFLIDIYRERPEAVRCAFTRAIADLLREMEDDAESTWRQRPEAGDSLLLLAGETCGREIAPIVRSMAYSGLFVGLGDIADGDLHSRLLQLMMAMGVQEPMTFWQEQARVDPAQYLPVAMRGAECAGQNPFAVLVGMALPRDELLKADITRVVDIMTSLHGAAWVSQQQAGVWRELPPETVAWLGWSEPNVRTTRCTMRSKTPLWTGCPLWQPRPQAA